MKLYKYMKAEDADEYLRTGRVEVVRGDSQHGSISFSTQSWSWPCSHRIDNEGIVLEFEVDGEKLSMLVNGADDRTKVLPVDLSDCELVGSTYMRRMEEFTLDSVILRPDCPMRWQYVRSWLRKAGKENASIKLLRRHERQGCLYVDEEFRLGEQGFYCLKYNPNHSQSDKFYLADIDCTVPQCCQFLRRECFAINEASFPRRLYKYMSTKHALEYLKTKMLKVTTLADCNDPNEWVPFLENEDDGSDYLADPNLRADFKRQRGSRFGFISFSSQMDNSILWAHYGDKFKGIALEFTLENDANVFPVRYRWSRYRINQAKLRKPCDMEEFRQFIAQKDVVWQHESEWRIVNDLAQCRFRVVEGGAGIYFSELNDKVHLSGIVLGPECPVKFGNVLTEVGAWKDNDFSIRRLAYDSFSYKLYVSDECKIGKPVLVNTRTIINTADGNMSQQVIPINGNE